LTTEILPNFMEFIKPYCEKGEFLLGSELSVADFWIGGLYTNYLANKANPQYEEWQQVLKEHPYFEEYGKRYSASLSSYLQKRPVYPI